MQPESRAIQGRITILSEKDPTAQNGQIDITFDAYAMELWSDKKYILRDTKLKLLQIK